jgi:integrase
MQARYQYGSLRLRKRKKGPDVWEFRWLENGTPKSMLIGTVEKLSTRADAERAVEHLRMKINVENPQQQFHRVTVQGLAERFMAEYALKKCRRNTRMNYQGLYNNHIKPKWGTEYIDDVRPMLVEDWFDGYNEYEVELKDGQKVKKPVSRAVKSHVRNLMHTMFERARFWEMLRGNPIDLVHQSQKRLKRPRVLEAEEFKLLVPQLAEPDKTMVIVHQCLGLRSCETVALKWLDFNFDDLTAHVQRSFVKGEVNEVKTDASDKVLPLDPDLAHILLSHKARSKFTGPEDFVFANAQGWIRWPESFLKDHIKPAARRAGIGNIGWHTFRHTYATLLAELDTNPAVQKELLRHANIATTMNVYTQAVQKSLRRAARKAVKALL